MNSLSDVLANMERDGFSEFDLNQPDLINAMQALLKKTLPLDRYQDQSVYFDAYAEQVKVAVDQMAESQLVGELLKKNQALITTLCGPDVDMQEIPHVRVARAQSKTDVTGWHRDTFYGNTPYEVNIWFPLMPLPEGSGLRLVRSSHLRPERNVRPAAIPEDIAKNRQVDRGSAANQIGFLYAPKTEDGIEFMDPKDDILVAPKLGHGIIFFGACIHGGATPTREGVRVSIDVRVRNTFAPTNTKPGFYVPLFRGLISAYSQKFLERELN